MLNTVLAKNLLLGRNCENCKWTSRQRIIPDLEVTLNVLENYTQICYSKYYVLQQDSDEIVVEGFSNNKASFWTECPTERICEYWDKF